MDALVRFLADTPDVVIVIAFLSVVFWACIRIETGRQNR